MEKKGTKKHHSDLNMSCHICKKKFDPKDVDQKSLPFCSKKCKLIDLGKWFKEDYNIIKDS